METTEQLRGHNIEFDFICIRHGFENSTLVADGSDMSDRDNTQQAVYIEFSRTSLLDQEGNALLLGTAGEDNNEIIIVSTSIIRPWEMQKRKMAAVKTKVKEKRQREKRERVKMEAKKGEKNVSVSRYLFLKYTMEQESDGLMVWFYGISTIIGYLMPNHLYTHILRIYDLVRLVFMAYQTLYVIKGQILFKHMLRIYDLVWLGFMAYQPL